MWKEVFGGNASKASFFVNALVEPVDQKPLIGQPGTVITKERYSNAAQSIFKRSG